MRPSILAENHLHALSVNFLARASSPPNPPCSTFSPANLRKLVQARILQEVKGRRRDQRYLARELIAVAHGLGSPPAGTRDRKYGSEPQERCGIDGPATARRLAPALA